MATAEIDVEIQAAAPRRRFELICGHVTESLRVMPAESVHTCVTSPPFWGLRAYGTDPQVHGGDPDCDHEWAEPERSPWANALPGPNGRTKNVEATRHRARTSGQGCTKCAAWLGELGAEPSYLLYVEHLVAIFREVWRVLRKDGTVWLNLGDSFITGAGRVGGRPGGGDRGDRWVGNRADRERYHGKHAAHTAQIGPMTQANRLPQPGLKAKNLAGIPWRVALALQDDGWILRTDIVWNKPNAMPSAARDRPSISHEYLFLLTKSSRYYYDRDAIREPLAASTVERDKHTRITKGKDGPYSVAHDHETPSHPQGRNKRSVWTITLKPFRGAHFATFPESLAEPCVKAGTSERGCCPNCGAPWKRIVHRQRTKDGVPRDDLPPMRNTSIATPSGAQGDSHSRYATIVETKGWKPTCRCPEHQPIPCTVLDTFNGSGTTGKVALTLGRHYLGIDLKAEYIELSHARLEKALIPPRAKIRKKKSLPAASEFLPLFDRSDDGSL